MANRLDCVRMEKRSMGMRDLTQLLNWLDAPKLVVCKHNRNKTSIPSNNEFLTISVSSRFSEASEKLAHSDARHISKKTHVIGLFFEEARDYGKKCFQLYAES